VVACCNRRAYTLAGSARDFQWRRKNGTLQIPRDAGIFLPLKLRWSRTLAVSRSRMDTWPPYFCNPTWRWLHFYFPASTASATTSSGTRSTLSAGIHFALLAVIGIPLGTILHFIQFRSHDGTLEIIADDPLRFFSHRRA